MNYDFSGWATRNNLKCSDGRTIMKDAFKHNNGKKVPLVWNHQHNEVQGVLGHANLENRNEGVYAYCKFNETEAGKTAKILVEHGDIVSLSILANQLKQQGGNVMHGQIREVSLVLASANPGAFIDSVIRHADTGEIIGESDDQAVIYNNEPLELCHKEEETKPNEEEKEKMSEEKKEKKEEKEETIADVFNAFTEKQKNVVYAMVGQALADAEKNRKKDTAEHSEINDEEGENDIMMKHNIFDENQEDNNSLDVLTHSEITAIFNDVKRYGSLKDTVLSHGIENIDFLFPDPKNVTNTPEMIQRDMAWVSKVFGATKKTPFSRIRSIFADLTEDEARAKGYITGNKKKEEVFGLLKRTTTPTTVYKKQKLERDDVVDITDFDVVAWLKREMRTMLDEELSRAILVGDGRNNASDDKINEQNIRPIWTDDDLFTIKANITTSSETTPDQRARAFIRRAIKARKEYKGSGSPTLYVNEDMLTDCLLIEDLNQRIIYDTEAKLATALRVKEIVSVPVMEDLSRDVSGKTHNLLGIIANLTDYNIGADKGGAVNMFDDFDIDFNAMKYLIETRCSGALVKPFSAIVIEELVETTASG